jgi:hypothetical protein
MTFASGVVTPALAGALFFVALSGFGCRESAPDDVIVEEETTAAIVFVKTKGEETLNRSWAEGNLYKLSPISPEVWLRSPSMLARPSATRACRST